MRDNRWDMFAPNQQRLIRLSLWLMAADARARATYAAQDLSSASAGRAVNAFLRDAERAEHLLGLLQEAMGTKPPEAAPDNTTES